MIRILLTGSGGFIGSHLKKQLSHAYEVIAPRSFELDLQDADATYAFVESHGIDLIIHSASCGVQHAENKRYDAVAAPNMAMFRNLAKCVNTKRRMIHLGSGAEYDKSKPIVHVREEEFGMSTPIDPYGYSKYSISKEIENKENILNLRIFGVYGEGEHSSRVTSSIMTDYIHRRPITLHQNVRFSFIYMNDLCRIIHHFAENPPKEKQLNIAHPSSIEIVQLAEMVNTFSDWKSEIIIESPGMNKEYTCNTDKLCSMWGEHFTSYEEGLRRLYTYMREKTVLP